MKAKLYAVLALAASLLPLPSVAVVTNYPWPASAPVSEHYSVKITQAGTTTTMTTLITKPNLLAGPDGDGVTGILEDRSLSYVPFAFTGEIDIEVTKLTGGAATRVELAPKAFGLEPYFFDGTKVRFKLNAVAGRPEYVSVNFVAADNIDDDGNGGPNIKNGLMLFGDAPETNVPSPTGPGVVVYSNTVSAAQLAAADIIYFPAGNWDLAVRYPNNPFKSVLPIGKNGQKVYAAPGAYIRGAVHGEGFDTLTVYGRGIFTGVDLPWHGIRDAAGVKDAFMNFLGSDNCTFEGCMVVNPTHHTWPSSTNNTYRHVKVLGWASNHDGLRPASGALIEEVFIKTSDDYDYARDPHEFRNSVIWPMRNGAFGMLGWNNLGSGFAEYRNLYFINPEWNTYKRNSGVIGSVLNQGVNLSGNVIENIYGENFLTQLANITIERDTAQPYNSANPGVVEDFTFRNIIFEKKMLAPNGTTTKNPIHGFVDTATNTKAMVRDISFINLVLGDTLVTAANAAQFFDIDPATTSNITFTTSGVIHTVTATAGAGGTVSPAGALPTPAGMTRTVAIVANAGFRVKDVTVNGVSLGRRQNITLTNVAANHTIAATFEAAATDTYDQLPLPWNGTDIGAVGAAGESFLSGTSLVLDASGADVWGSADEFHFAHQEASGDCEIKARVSSLENTHGFALAGVMIRDGTAAGAKHVFMALTPTSGARLRQRTTTNGTTTQNTGNDGIVAPYWVRLVRTGNSFTGYKSANGTTWTQVGTTTITMGANVRIGLAGCSHADGTLGTSTFTNVTVTP